MQQASFLGLALLNIFLNNLDGEAECSLGTSRGDSQPGDGGAEVERILHPEGRADKAHRGQPQQLCSCLALQLFVDSAGI